MILVELGPGHGTLIQDILKILKLSGMLSHISSTHLIEISPNLQKIQQDRLKAEDNIFFHSSFDDIPKGPAIIVANEFFDAFPIQQWKGSDQVKVYLDARDELIVDSIEFAYKERGAKPIKYRRETSDAVGMFKSVDYSPHVLEKSPKQELYFLKILEHLKSFGGLFLTIDYGDQNLNGNTFQALFKHKKISPFHHIGHADLTSHVNFGTLQTLAHKEGFQTQFLTQRDFLLQEGIEHLKEKYKTPEEDYARLIATMGTLFKVLIVY